MVMQTFKLFPLKRGNNLHEKGRHRSYCSGWRW